MAADMIMAADMREAAALKKAQDSYSKKSKTAGSMWHQKKLRERKAAQIGEINMAAVNKARIAASRGRSSNGREQTALY